MSPRDSGFTPVTYFSCTLGEAQQLNGGKVHFKSVIDLIDVQARRKPEEFAVGFPLPRDGNTKWTSQLFSFQQLKYGSTINIEQTKSLAKIAGATRTIGLICPSSIEFLFSWLRLMRAGYSVLLIAPQCTPEAIAHLCKVSEAQLLLYHEIYKDLANSASDLPESNLRAVALPWTATDVINSTNHNHAPKEAPENDIAFIFHTSGTSGGLPKAIPQTQHGAVGVLPSLDGEDAASFTTTPLYHGGIADCLRAWSSTAMIWLFPATDVPITNKNILNCYSSAEEASQMHQAPRVKYFSSVPYILEMLASEKPSLEMLTKMDMVGVGGAALSPKIGDRIVQQEVKLLSRFGSAECGFLLSSHRNYAKDDAWQFLRVAQSSPYLNFEPQSDDSGLCELVILKGWPHMSKTNRGDGSFATNDLFEPHPKIQSAWRYHSRSDSQITLATGKKFDPAPVEDAIRSALTVVEDVLVFGNDKPEAGAIVIPSQDVKSAKDIEADLWEVIHQLNEQGQSHTGLSRSMIAIMPVGTTTFDKSSKGSILRRKAEDRFAVDIENLYNGGDSEDTEDVKLLTDLDIRSVVKEVVISIVGKGSEIKDDSDFYQYGVDSNQCTRIRSQLQKKLNLPVDLPFNVVYDCGNVIKLSQYIIDAKNGNVGGGSDEGQFQHMRDMALKFSTFRSSVQVEKNPAKGSTKLSSVVVLTGATGSLGAHILHTLRSMSAFSRIICLVRASSYNEAHARVSSSLLARKKAPLELDDRRIVCVPAKLEQEDLQLTPELYTYIQNRCTVVIHAAWPVNFSLSLASFEPQFQGLQNLINVAFNCQQNPLFLFCSSTASVLGMLHPEVIPESLSLDPSDADSLGYSRSKWVAEMICANASNLAEKKSRIHILRIGQLTGDTENGIWNLAEAYPTMLSTVTALGCLPRLDEDLNWLPVDVAAKSVVEIALNAARIVESGTMRSCSVYHLVNNHRRTTWFDLLSWLQNSTNFQIVDLDVWLKRLERLDTHPAQNLAWLWKRGVPSTEHAVRKQREKVTFVTAKVESTSSAMRNVYKVDEALVGRIWTWLEAEMATAKETRSKL